ncbi:P-loop containing nucleoside triphosphate hydrolase protein [Auriscalpium vulgare]|uniref:P-loop containing nucleoside triphosphate hydrolase protein n=1 Tax=Auriscalpium vulgare TaxID=40419 RepID=A0ACB8SC96_9AGAM|nr:P-loop containing nucleoside triphosphate hydrolase protein [Auriscalpium vulgare]
MSNTPPDVSDAFVKVSFQEDSDGDPFYGHWFDQASAKHSGPTILISEYLRKLYPGHSLLRTSDYRLNLLGFPGVDVQAISPSELITSIRFQPLPKNAGPVPGAIAHQVQYGAFKLTWQTKNFILYIATWPVGFSDVSMHFLLHEGPEDLSRELLLSAGIWADQLHDEIWVFNQGFWNKDGGLWKEVQKANWSDVILEDEFKAALKKDVNGFFSSEWTYKQLALPWKRGLIMYGPPGNGKTISIKAIMKECDAKGYSPLYVKSFQSWMGEEGSMAAVFAKARQNSPCVLILEDLDSLINDSNRSFFLNELDGLQGNDGLLVIGTTNHFDRLDPGLSTRPSRFDRKYLYDDPSRDARVLYVQYWQGKLKDNDKVDFPDGLVQEIADLTDRFSFAYLKEAFVSSLVTFLLDDEDGKAGDFETSIKSQIKTLRKQLDKGAIERPVAPTVAPVPRELVKDVRPLLDAVARKLALSPYGSSSNGMGILPSAGIAAANEKDIRPLLDALAQRLSLSEHAGPPRSGDEGISTSTLPGGHVKWE